MRCCSSAPSRASRTPGASLAWSVVTAIVAWWFLSPVVGFWLCVMIGRYFYPRIDRTIPIDRSEGPLFALDRSGPVPRPTVEEETTRRELVGSAVVVGIGCLMACSSGTSNIANAIAPLVGSGALGMNVGIVVGYFLRVWENMSVYERVLEREVAAEAEEQVASEVAEQVPEEAHEQVPRRSKTRSPGRWRRGCWKTRSTNSSRRPTTSTI